MRSTAATLQKIQVQYWSCVNGPAMPDSQELLWAHGLSRATEPFQVASCCLVTP